MTDVEDDAAPVEERHRTVQVVADAASFQAAVDAVAGGEGPVAVDAERASGYRYSQRAYLVQMYRRGAGVFLFDPIAIDSFEPLQEAIAEEEWVFHAASQDLPCLREIGLDPSTIFDTELGARLAGFERVGLGAVVEELLGVHLAKAHSAADWSTRPLPQSWLVYAALDVELLVDARDALAARLAAAGKSEIARQEFAAVLSRPPKPPRAEPWRRMSGLHSLRGRRNLAIARSLWLARDDFARTADVSPGRVIPDGSIVAAVAANPTSKEALAAVSAFRGRASRTELDRWWDAIEAGRATDDLPPVRASTSSSPSLPPARAWADRNPAADRRYRAARAVVTARAEALDMPVENLLTPDVLRHVAWAPPAPATARSVADALAALDARPWQTDATAAIIAEAFVAVEQDPAAGAAPQS